MARLTGKNLNLFTLLSEEYVGLIRSCEIERSYDTQENRALKDAYHYMAPVIEDWRISFTQVVDGTTAFTGTKTNAARLMGLVGSSLSFTVETGDATENGVRYSGTGVLRTGRHTVPDGIQEVSFELEPQSALTVTQL